jgi:oligopeptide transport system substrate-binding protein
MFSKKMVLALFSAVVVLSMLAAACAAPAAPETIIETVVETVVVEKEGETIVETVVVEVEKIVEVPAEAAPGEELVTLNMDWGTEPPSLDPSLATDNISINIAGALFLGLTTFEGDQVVPQLATDWESPDGGQTWIFNMRDDVVWINYNPATGEFTELGPVTAHDVVYGVKRTLDPRTASTYAYALYSIENAEAINTSEATGEELDALVETAGVEALDDYTVQFTLDSAAGFFPAIAGMWVARPMPQAVIEERGERWVEPGFIVTNGPYVLEEWAHDDHLNLLKNPFYYDADNVQIEKIEGIMVTEASTAMALYEAGELDTLGDTVYIPLPDMDRIKADPVLSQEYNQASDLGTYYYGFVNTKPPFDNHLVRKAFSAAIDRQAIVENITKQGQTPAMHFAPPGIFGAPPIDEVGIGTDPEQARAWLAEAGYPDCEGLGEVRMMHNTSEAHAQIAQAIQQMWKEVLNCDVVIENQEWAVYLNTLNKTTPVEEVPHIFRMGWGADYPDENNWVHEVMNSSAGANRLRRGCLDPNCEETEDLEFDKLTQQAKEETDPEKRVELYREAERLLAEEETAFAPIYHYTSPWMVKPYVGNWYYQPAGGQHYWEWTIDWEAKKEATGQ